MPTHVKLAPVMRRASGGESATVGIGQEGCDAATLKSRGHRARGCASCSARLARNRSRPAAPSRAREQRCENVSLIQALVSPGLARWYRSGITCGVASDGGMPSDNSWLWEQYRLCSVQVSIKSREAGGDDDDEQVGCMPEEKVPQYILANSLLFWRSNIIVCSESYGVAWSTNHAISSHFLLYFSHCLFFT